MMLCLCKAASASTTAVLVCIFSSIPTQGTVNDQARDSSTRPVISMGRWIAEET